MTDMWVKHTLRFVSKSNIWIVGSHSTLQDWREGDSMLMDDFAAAPGHTFTKEDMTKANQCRQYLQVTTRSDIASGNGMRILHSAWPVEKEWKAYSSSAYKWPDQKQPAAGDVPAWQKLLNATYGVTASHLGWAKQLGPIWKDTRPLCRWQYDRNTDHLYQKQGHKWRRWTKLIRRVQCTRYIPTNDVEEMITIVTHPAVVICPPCSNTAYLEGYDQHTKFNACQETQEEERDKQRPRTLRDTIVETDKNLQWVLEECNLPADEGMEVARRTINGSMEVVCDRSLQLRLGTSAGRVHRGSRLESIPRNYEDYAQNQSTMDNQTLLRV